MRKLIGDIVCFEEHYLVVLIWLIMTAVWPVRDFERFPVKLHEKLKWAKTFGITLKPLLAIPRVELNLSGVAFRLIAYTAF